MVKLPNNLEDILVELLLLLVPPDQRAAVHQNVVHGPAMNADGRTDVVTSQGEVDDLFVSLSFWPDVSAG